MALAPILAPVIVWMVRLGIAARLLTHAVLRTGTPWWVTGYHAGWNLASAPFFGAVGSGYVDQGTTFTFRPSGSDLITGGGVGPEGSLLAFIAVPIGWVLLLATVPPQPAPSGRTAVLA